MKKSTTMASILRTYKYINVFTGQYSKTYKKSCFPLQQVFKTQNGVEHVNRKYSTVAITKFSEEHLLPYTPRKALEDVKDKYVTSKSSSSIGLQKFLNSFNSYLLPTSEKLVVENEICTLIYCCGSAMKNEMPNVRAQFLNNMWDLIKSLELKLNLSHYNALLRVYLENEQDFSPAEILLEMSNKGIEPNYVTYEYLLTQYSRKGNIEEANKILNYLKENEIPVNENVFNALIIGNAKANDMKGALRIFSIMKIMGCPPSSKTYAALLEAYAKEGDIENIMETIRKCESKNIILLDKYKMDIVYHLAINGHGKHIEEVLSTFAWDSTFVNENKNLISKLVYHKQIDIAIQVILSAKRVGLPDSQLNAISQAFAKSIIGLDLPEEKIIESFNLLEKEGFNVYESSLLASFQSQNVKYCIPLLRAWSKLGFEIKEHFFWPIFVMQGLQNSNGVLETLQTMKNEMGIMPSFETLTRFVLPYIQNSNTIDISKILINDLGIPIDNAINAIIFNDLSKNRVENAVKSARGYARYNINYDKKRLLPLLEKAFSKTQNERSYNVLNKILKGKSDVRYDKMENYLLPVLYNLDLGFKLQKCSKEGDLDGAEKCLRDIKKSQSSSISMDKLLCYCDLLVKKDRITDALQILEYFTSNRMCHIRFNQKTLEQFNTSLNLLADKGSVEGVNQLFDILEKKKLNVTVKFTEPLVRVHLVRNESKEALEVVKKLYNKYEHISGRPILMKKFIEAEEVESLQWLTDFGIQHQGERLTLMSLAVAFIKCQRSHQCKRILKSASVPLTDDGVRFCINGLFAEDDISTVESLLEVTKGLNTINRNILYDMLLEKYSLMNNWEKGLELWKKMQEESVVPTEIFLVILSELLKRNGQSTSHLVPLSSSGLQGKEDFYAKLTRMYIKKNSFPCREFLEVLVKNLVDAGDLETTKLIEDNWLHLYNDYLLNNSFKFEVFVKTNKIDSYLKQIKTKIVDSDRSEAIHYTKQIDNTWLNYLLKHPENLKSFETLAMQSYSKHFFDKPLLVILSYYFLKDLPKAKKLWADNSSAFFQQSKIYRFIIQSFVNSGHFDQLPQLAEIFHEFLDFQKKIFYEEFLCAYEEQNKYEEGLRVLATFKPPTRDQKRFEENSHPEPIKSQIAL